MKINPILEGLKVPDPRTPSVEMDVHFGGAVLRIEPQRPGHFGQGGQQAAIHGGEAT